MREIGVRDLKAQLSKVLGEVGRGARFKVTRRGRHVADLLPPESDPAEAQMRKLIAEGRVTPPSAPLQKNPPPPIDTGTSASALILAEREEDR